MKTLVLASSSKYRKAQFDRLGLEYSCCAPHIDETPKFNESGLDLVKRLSLQKAISTASKFTDSLIIGSDQVALYKDSIIGKPGCFDKAFAQLKSFSGQTVSFLTGICLLNTETRFFQLDVAFFDVAFRVLTDEKIKNYLNKEQPYDCAGSFKSEGLGIALFEKLSGDDPNSLIGLPLIKLITMLEKEGVSPL